MTVEEFNAALIEALFVGPSSGGHLTSDNLITAIQQALDTASKTLSVAEFGKQVVKNLAERLGGAGICVDGQSGGRNSDGPGSAERRRAWNIR